MEAMEKPPRYSLIPLGALVGVVAVLLIAALAAWETSEELAYFAKLRRATVASPHSGPAVYRGKLFGPPARATPTKVPAAAYWWRITTGASKSRKVSCKDDQSLGLELRDGDAKLSLDAFAGKISVLSDAKDGEWSEKRVVDVGKLKPRELSNPPVSCEGSNPSYVEHSIPQGTEVEVVACYRVDGLKGCDVGLTGIFVPTLAIHRERRADRAFIPFFVAAMVCTLIVTALFVVSIVARRRALSPLRPGRHS
jgi:hypothetical protein